MTIYFYDGSYMECDKIEFCGEYIYADEYRTAKISEVEKIES